MFYLGKVIILFLEVPLASGCAWQAISCYRVWNLGEYLRLEIRV